VQQHPWMILQISVEMRKEIPSPQGYSIIIFSEPLAARNQKNYCGGEN